MTGLENRLKQSRYGYPSFIIPTEATCIPVIPTEAQRSEGIYPKQHCGSNSFFTLTVLLV
jgi:hypothetical protein